MKTFSGSDDIMITAHSGCDGTEMNTMEYLKYAVSIPVDALEIDVRRSEDGALVLGHGPAEGSAQLPLETAFRFLSDKVVKINCDMKEAGLSNDILDCARRCAVETRRIIFTGVIDEHMTRQTDAQVFVNAEELIPGLDDSPLRPESVAALIRRCREAGYSTVNIDYRQCDDAMIQMLRKAGIGLSVWTVDDPEKIRAFMNEGVRNITTNLVKEACRRKP